MVRYLNSKPIKFVIATQWRAIGLQKLVGGGQERSANEEEEGNDETLHGFWMLPKSVDTRKTTTIIKTLYLLCLYNSNFIY